MASERQKITLTELTELFDTLRITLKKKSNAYLLFQKLENTLTFAN